MKVALLIFIFPLVTFAESDTSDPNGYFRPRSWSIKDDSHKPDHYISAKSEYRAEPIQKPNKLVVEHRCGKKTIPMFTIKYCGINSMKMVGGKLEIMFVDFHYKNPKGYCTKKRTQYFKVPKCP